MEETLRRILALLEQMNDRRERLLSAFLSGVLRGIGTMIGFAVLGTALLWLLQSIARANLPLISEFVARVVTLVQMRLQ